MENGYKQEIEDYLKDTDDINFEIRSLRKDNRDATLENNMKIEKLEQKMGDIEFRMREAFTKSGEEKVQTKMGFTTWKTMDVLFNFTDKAIEEIEIAYPKTAIKYIKTSKTLIKAPLKKDIIDEKITLSLDSFRLEGQERKFVYKYTGGNK